MGWRRAWSFRSISASSSPKTAKPPPLISMSCQVRPPRASPFAHVLVGHEAVGEDAIGDLTGDARHALADGGEEDPGPGEAAGAGLEERVHEGEAVGVADVVGLLAGFEGVPDGVEGADVVTHAGCGGAPGHAEATLDVALHLAAEAEREAPASRLLQVPGAHRQHHGGARESDRERTDLDALGRHRGGGGEDHGVVRHLAGAGRVVAELLEPLRRGTNVREPARRVTAANLHRALLTGERSYRAGRGRGADR